MSHGPYIETRSSPTVAPIEDDGGRELSPREKPIARGAHGSRTPDWDAPAQPNKAPAGIPDAATTPVPAALRAEIEEAVSRYPDAKSAIIPALWAAQRVHHWCSPTAISQVATVLGRTPAEILAVATFYDMFETTEVGKHTIYVCTNISCSLRGADALLHKFEQASSGREDEFHVRGFECLGACDIAPMISVDGLYVGPINVDEVESILETVAAGGELLPERQVNNRKSVDPQAGDTPHRGQPATDAAGAADHAVGAPDPGRESDPYVPSDPAATEDTPDAKRATGQDPKETP